MTQLLSSRGVDISQRNFQQIIIRGDGKDQFNQIINQEISILPPSKNLEVTINDKFMFAKNSFDQWSLVYLVEQNYKEDESFGAGKTAEKFLKILNSPTFWENDIQKIFNE